MREVPAADIGEGAQVVRDVGDGVVQQTRLRERRERTEPAGPLVRLAVANLGFAGRDNSPIPDSAAVHFEPRFEIAPRITLAPFIEYFLPFAHTDFYSVPVGAGLYVVPDRAVDVGVIFRFTDLFKHTVGTPPASFDTGGPEGRSLTFFVTVRL